MHPDVSHVILTEEQIRSRVRELGHEISRDYADGGSVLLVGVLRGAVLFVADLMRELSIPCEIDFMAVSSYGSSSTRGSRSSTSSRTSPRASRRAWRS